MSIDKLKQAVVLEIKKLEKKSGALKKDIDKLIRGKGIAEGDIAEANARKAKANDDAKKSAKALNDLRADIKVLNNSKKEIARSVDKLTEDAVKREVKISSDEEELARVIAETSENNLIAKTKANGAVGLTTQLENQIKEVEEIKKKIRASEGIADEKISEAEEIKQKALAELKRADSVNSNSKSLKLESQVLMQEIMAEKEKYESLVKSLEKRHEEKNKEIVKVQEMIARVKDRELKVKQEESMVEAREKSLKSEKNRIALKEAKVDKILSVLLKDKKIQDQLKELGLIK